MTLWPPQPMPTSNVSVKIEELEPGDPFRYDTLEGRWQYGHLIFKNASRARVVLYDYAGPAWDHADDKLVSGKSHDTELNLPLGLQCERILVNSNINQDQDYEGGPMAVDSVKAAGLVAKYNHQQRQWQKAVETGDAGKAEVALNRIKALEQEAKAAGIELPDWDPERATHPDTGVELNGAHKPDSPDPLRPKPTVAGRALTPEERAEVGRQQKAAAKSNAAKASAAKATTPEEKAKALASTKPTLVPKPKPQLRTHDCLCGCGGETQALYAPGHDARVKGILLKVERGELPFDVIPETVQPFVRFKGKPGTEEYMLDAAPVKVPGRPEIEDMRQQAMEALDV